MICLRAWEYVSAYNGLFSGLIGAVDSKVKPKSGMLDCTKGAALVDGTLRFGPVDGPVPLRAGHVSLLACRLFVVAGVATGAPLPDSRSGIGSLH